MPLHGAASVRRCTSWYAIHPVAHENGNWFEGKLARECLGEIGQLFWGNNIMAMTRRRWLQATAALVVGGTQATAQAGLADYWYAFVNWTKIGSWGPNWVSIARQKILAVKTNWKRLVLLKALDKAIGGAAADKVREYLEKEGMYCPAKPWWLLLGPYEVVWVVITCTHHAE